MSFSMQVKEELLKQISPARHCRIAETAAIIWLCGKYSYKKSQGGYIKVSTENLTVASKYFILLEKTFKIRAEVMVRGSHNTTYYQVVVHNDEDVLNVLKAVKLIRSDDEDVLDTGIIGSIITQNTCCKRAFIRGAFMAAGSITDPEKSYHFEIACTDENKAERIGDILHAFNIDSRHTIRKRNYVVYLKEGSQICDVLNVMEAHVALMKLENIRIYKEMRNSVNRKVNCEAANISKTTEAALRQSQDIMYIRDNLGIGNLTDHLQEIARIRLDNPDVSLKELGELLHPVLGKSGVNHRLRRLSEIASDLRRLKEEKNDIQKH